MAASPQFANVANVGSGLVPATADTSLTAPTNATTIVTGGSSGTKVEELVCVGVGTTVAGLINIFLHDGSTYHLFDQITVQAITPSATVPSWRGCRKWANCIVKSGWTLRVSNTVAGNQSLIKCTGVGGDF